MRMEIFGNFDCLTDLNFDELDNAVVQDVQTENIVSQSGSKYDN